MKLKRRDFVNLSIFGVFAGFATLFKGGGKPVSPGKPPKHTTTIPSSTSSTSTTHPTTTIPTTTTTIAGVRRPEQDGAVGDGIADDTAALQAAFNAGGTIVCDLIYRHTAVIVVGVNGTHISGVGELRATNPGQSALKITGNNVTIDGDLLLSMPTSSPRLTTDQSSKLWLSNCFGAVISNVTINRSASAGIFVKGSSFYRIANCVVSNTLADSYHNTGASHDGIFDNCSSINGGDDGFAVVSYQLDGAQCYNIVFNSPRFYRNTWGRGFSVVGGHDVTFNDIYGEDSNAGMLYFASESQWNTYPASRVNVNGGTIRRANYNANTDHGAVMIYDSNGLTQSEITIRDINIYDTRVSASRQVGIIGQGTVCTKLINFIISGGGTNLLQADGTYNSSGWKFNGNPIPAHTGC